MTETKIVSLTLGERLAAIKIFDAFKGGLSTLSALIEDVKSFTITEDEWTKASLRKTPTDEEISRLTLDEKKEVVQSWKWEEKAADGSSLEKEITLQNASLNYLKEEIQKKSDAGEITLGDIALVSLQKKL